MSTHQDSLAAFFGRSPLSSVPPGYNRSVMIEVIKVEIEYINLQYNFHFSEIYRISTAVCSTYLRF